MFKHVKKVAAIVFALTTVTAVCFGGDKDNKVIKAGYVPSGYYWPLILVAEDGLLAKQGYSFELQRFNSNSDMINAFLNGQLDVCAQSAFTMFPIEAKYPGRFKFVYGQYNESYSFVVSTNENIKTLADLKGKIIGTWQSPTAEVCIKIVLQKKAGLNYDDTRKDYTIQRFGAKDVAEKLVNGNVDAVFLFDVESENLVSNPTFNGKFIYLMRSAMKDFIDDPANPGVGIPVHNGGGFISTELIATNPGKARAVRKAMQDAVEIITNQRDHAATVLANHLKVPQDVALHAAYDRFHFVDQNSVKSAENTLLLLKTTGFVDQDIEVKNLFWLE